jgi:hypothetical protein
MAVTRRSPLSRLQSDILADTTIDCVDIRRQLDPSLQHPALYVACVQPHIHRPAAHGAETRHRAEQSHVWDVDVYGGGDQVVCGV